MQDGCYKESESPDRYIYIKYIVPVQIVDQITADGRTERDGCCRSDGPETECRSPLLRRKNIANGNTNDNAYKWLVLGNIMIGTFMAVLDSTVVNTGLPAIMGTLGASINTAEWVLTGYMLAIASILPAAAWLSDRFGYKRIYFLSLLVFTFGSFMCGNSTFLFLFLPGRRRLLSGCAGQLWYNCRKHY